MTRGQSYAAVSDIVSAKDEMKIAKVAQQHGSAPTRSSIIAMLIYMNMQLHLASSLTDDNIRAIADDLTNNPEIKWWLTLADVQMLCRNILNGTYAHYYNRFGLETFYECFGKYCAERNAVHFYEADKETSKPDPDVLHEVGYKVDEHGNLVVPEEVKQKTLPPPLYLYSADGKKRRDNPAAWKKVNKEDRNRQDRVLGLARAYMNEDHTLNLKDAIEKAANIEENRTNKQ